MPNRSTLPGDVPTVTNWPPFHPGETLRGYRRLARYVSVPALRGLDLVEHEAHKWRGDPRELLSRLYLRLRSKRIPYNRAWVSGAHQRIRDPHLIDRSSGTCLDLVLMFAAMCEAAGLRPYVTVLDHHAVVLVHTDPEATALRLSEPPVTPRHEHDGGVFLAYGEGLRLRGGTAIDVVGACRGEDRTFAEACASGARRLESGHDDVRMVDVVGLHAEGAEDVRELPLVRDESRPAIYRRLPARPQFVDFPGRDKFMAELRDLAARGGTVVLHGPQGVGKSMAAHQLAARADEGCGWFLDAFDQRTLTASLGDAEIEERGRPGGDARDDSDRTVFAELAMKRLADSEVPWVVVLDNVDVDPTELRLPRPSRQGQLVVVTTTNAKWADPETNPTLRNTDAEQLAVPELGVDDLPRVLDVEDAPTDLLAGRPLLLEASARLLRSTGQAWWRNSAVQPTAPEEVPAAIWSTVVREAEAGAPGGPLHDPVRVERRLATAMAWLPPSGLSPELLALAVRDEGNGAGEQPEAGAGQQPEVRAGLERLRALGVIDFTGGLATMHRLFQHAVREHGLRQSPTDTAALVGGVYRNFFTATGARQPAGTGRTGLATPFDLVLDPREVGSIADLLTHQPSDPDAFRSLHALGVLVERQDPAAATECFEKALERVANHGAGADAESRIMRSDCLRGKARVVHRTPGRSPWGTVDDAIGWAVEARELCAVPNAGRDEQLAASRAEAMHGLLIRRKANKDGLTAGQRLALLREAEVLLRHSAAERELLTGHDSPDADRSRFNLAGLEVSLAQVDPDLPPHRHLDAADEHYQAVLALRERRYGTRHLEEVITCVNGLALVNFYRAVLQDAGPAQRVTFLTHALRHAHEALEVRQSLAILIEANVTKSLDILAKTALARLDARQPVANAEKPAGAASEMLYATYRRESADGLFTVRPTHEPTGPTDAPDPADAPGLPGIPAQQASQKQEQEQEKEPS
ncbi:AAA family ATPase [Streptomyces sp. NPDC002328]|uniref:AAA family ATPase n=1 Tax=Streptomyces sp. NPDC002328 TaxID=3364642 RepID=UPI0036AE5C22